MRDATAWIAVTVALFAGSTADAGVQRAELERWLRANVPSGISRPTAMSQCRTLRGRWVSLQRRIGKAHQQCLTDRQGNRNDGQHCTYAACEDLHTLMNSQKLRAIEADTIRSCEKAVRRFQVNKARLEPQARRRERLPAPPVSVLGKGAVTPPAYSVGNTLAPPASTQPGTARLTPNQAALLQEWIEYPERRRREIAERLNSRLPESDVEFIMDIGTIHYPCGNPATPCGRVLWAITLLKEANDWYWQNQQKRAHRLYCKARIARYRQSGGAIRIPEHCR